MSGRHLYKHIVSRAKYRIFRILRVFRVLKLFRLLLSPASLQSCLANTSPGLRSPDCIGQEQKAVELQGAVGWVLSARFARPDAFAARLRNTKDVSTPARMSWHVSFAMLACGDGDYAAVCFCPQQQTRYVTHAFSSRSQTHTASPFRLKQSDTITLSFH
jgi:hypothetical protein